MKTLVIVANPRKESYSHALASAYIRGAKKRGEAPELLDLYDSQQAFFSFDFDQKNTDIQKQMHSLLQKHEHYVFVFPVWWGNIPAILKNFFDVNFSSGFAFEFVSGQSFPNKLLTGKTAELIYHSDAPEFLYKIPFFSGIHIAKYLDKLILGFCGVKLTKVLAIGGLRKKTQEQRKAILEKLEK